MSRKIKGGAKKGESTPKAPQNRYKVNPKAIQALQGKLKKAGYTQSMIEHQTREFVKRVKTGNLPD